MPLFPGYVFAHVDLHSGPRMYTIPGLIRILGYGGIPTPLSDDELEVIRAIGSSRLPVESSPYFSVGEPIILIDGPLCGVRGSFIATKRGGQLIVALPLLHRSLAVNVRVEWIARDDTASATIERKILSV